MSFVQDLKILYHLALRPVRGADHAERLENFYSGQADAYDDFRKRLLHGREQLYHQVPIQPGMTWVDMGGGTGSNLEFIAEKLPDLHTAYIVDLSPSLLKVAQRRVAAKGWSNVQTVQADATRWQPESGGVDVVTFSYSLTMIPDWYLAIENAIGMLKPGGVLAVVDFYVSRKFPAAGAKRHPWFLACLVCLRQCLSELRSPAVPSIASRDRLVERVPIQGTVPSLHPNTLLSVPRPQVAFFNASS